MHAERHRRTATTTACFMRRVSARCRVNISSDLRSLRAFDAILGPGPVFVLNHSFGAVCAFEAAFQTAKLARLALYEPPVRAADHSATLARMEPMMRTGEARSSRNTKFCVARNRPRLAERNARRRRG